jgi:hypothetical protein
MKTLVSILCLLLMGCATAPEGARTVKTTAELPTIREKLAVPLSQVKPGMALDEFRGVFPSASAAGNQNGFDAYEVSLKQGYVTEQQIIWRNLWLGFGSPPAKLDSQALWFYFRDNKLLSWGDPNRWP